MATEITNIRGVKNLYERISYKFGVMQDNFILLSKIMYVYKREENLDKRLEKFYARRKARLEKLGIDL